MLRKPPKATASSPKPSSATGQPRATSPAGASVNPRRNANRDQPCADVEPMLPPCALDRRGSALSGADADHVIHGRDEDLPIPDPPGARPADDGVYRLPHPVIRHQQGDVYLGQEIHHVLGAAIELGVALLTPESLDLLHRQSGDSGLRKGFHHLIEHERLDDRVDSLHPSANSATAVPSNQGWR